MTTVSLDVLEAQSITSLLGGGGLLRVRSQFLEAPCNLPRVVCQESREIFLNGFTLQDWDGNSTGILFLLREPVSNFRITQPWKQTPDAQL